MSVVVAVDDEVVGYILVLAQHRNGKQYAPGVFSAPKSQAVARREEGASVVAAGGVGGLAAPQLRCKILDLAPRAATVGAAADIGAYGVALSRLEIAVGTGKGANNIAIGALNQRGVAVAVFAACALCQGYWFAPGTATVGAATGHYVYVLGQVAFVEFALVAGNQQAAVVEAQYCRDAPVGTAVVARGE